MPVPLLLTLVSARLIGETHRHEPERRADDAERRPSAEVDDTVRPDSG